jgi:tetratricopeptide (TPR) repeat protein
MSKEIEKLLAHPVNQFVLVEGSQTLYQALQKVKEKGGGPDWCLLVKLDTGKYLAAKIEEVNQHAQGDSQKITSTALKDFGAPLHPAQVIESTEDLSSILRLFKKNKGRIIVVTLMDMVVGIIHPSSLEQDVAEESSIEIESKPKAKKTGLAQRGVNLVDRLRSNPIYIIISFILFSLIIPLWSFATDMVIPFFQEQPVMTGEWNVAVAGFTVLEKGEIDQAQADLIGTVFFNRLESELTELKTETDIIIEVWGPDQVGFISGDSPEERAENAEKLASKINSDVIVYGTIDREGNTLTIQPEFYVSVANFYEAEEMVGQHALGGSISIIETGEGITSQINLNRELSKRSQVLSLLTKGLSLYFTHAYEDARVFFQEANKDDYWQTLSGREVVYLFEGNAAGKSRLLEEAEEAYHNALAYQEEYARAYAGLGSVYYLQALEETQCKENFEPDQGLLDSAKYNFDQALKARVMPASADIPTKVAIGLGQVYLAEWFAGEDTVEKAIEQFNLVLTQYGSGANPRVQEFASEAQGRLGLIERQIGNTPEAIARFENALELATHPGRRGLYLATLADLYESQGESEKALDASQKSIEEFTNALTLTTHPEQRAEYWEVISTRYEKLGETDEAINAMKAAIKELSPDSCVLEDYQDRLNYLQ